MTWTLDMASVPELSGPAGRPEAFSLAVPSTVTSATLASDLQKQLLQQHAHTSTGIVRTYTEHPGLRLERLVSPEWLLEPLMDIPGVEDPFPPPFAPSSPPLLTSSFWSGLGL